MTHYSYRLFLICWLISVNWNEGSKWSDCIADVLCSVSKPCEARGEHLDCGEELGGTATVDTGLVREQPFEELSYLSRRWRRLWNLDLNSIDDELFQLRRSTSRFKVREDRRGWWDFGVRVWKNLLVFDPFWQWITLNLGLNFRLHYKMSKCRSYTTDSENNDDDSPERNLVKVENWKWMMMDSEKVHSHVSNHPRKSSMHWKQGRRNRRREGHGDHFSRDWGFWGRRGRRWRTEWMIWFRRVLGRRTRNTLETLMGVGRQESQSTDLNNGHPLNALEPFQNNREPDSGADQRMRCGNGHVECSGDHKPGSASWKHGE